VSAGFGEHVKRCKVVHILLHWKNWRGWTGEGSLSRWLSVVEILLDIVRLINYNSKSTERGPYLGKT